MSFVAPTAPQGDMVKPADLNGHLLIITPIAMREGITTSLGEADAIAVDLVDLTDGVEYHDLPDLKALGSQAPLVIDFSSHVASRSIDWSKVGLAFGGAQKNLGPAGLTLVVVREDLLDQLFAVRVKLR